ncbi:hypothetical protein RB601_008062 [Gaeumannomyces tritici]
MYFPLLPKLHLQPTLPFASSIPHAYYLLLSSTRIFLTYLLPSDQLGKGHVKMDPISALSIATSIIAFADFGNRITSVFSALSEIRRSDDGLPRMCSALVAEANALSSHVEAAKETVLNLRARYPKRAKEFERLDKDCTLAGQELHALLASLKPRPGTDLKSRTSQAITAAQGLRKGGDIKALEERFGRIRQQTQLSVTMCIWEDVEVLKSQQKATDRKFNEEIQYDASPTSRDQLQAPGSRRRNVLWESTAPALEFAGPVTHVPQHSDSSSPLVLNALSTVQQRILEGLIFEDMVARKKQIQSPFPRTFEWLLRSSPLACGEASLPQHNPQTHFTKWLAASSDTPFWITGKPASGKSTLMKFICTDPRVKEGLKLWSGSLRLVVCDIYIWNAGFSRQKDQLGLLRTILYQILLQEPQLCYHVAPKHYLYFQLPVDIIPDSPDWTVDQLRDAITRVASAAQSSHRFAIFIDGLDEYEGDLPDLVEFLKGVCEGPAVKLCVSSRPWNVFKDAFHTFPSLKMELLTKPDIEEYVQKRMAGSRAFQELRCIDASSVDNLESQTVEKSEGIFLWVVLVVESLLITAQDDGNLQTIWKVFQALPPGLDQLYSSMRSRLDQARLEQASKMYQILFQWKTIKIENQMMPDIDFWVAANHDEDLTPPTNNSAQATIKPLLERQVGGCTGGMVQIVISDRGCFVDFLHRTVYDWLKEQWTTVINDGPADYDPAMVIASTLALRGWWESFRDIFAFGRLCNESLASKAAMVRIVDGLRPDDVQQSLRDIAPIYATTNTPMLTSQLSDEQSRVLMAIGYAWAPYLEAKLENGLLEQVCGFPRRRLFGVPMPFKSKTPKYLLPALAYAITPPVSPHIELDHITRTVRVLLQIPSIPRKEIIKQIRQQSYGQGGQSRYKWEILELLEGRSTTNKAG